MRTLVSHGKGGIPSLYQDGAVPAGLPGGSGGPFRRHQQTSDPRRVSLGRGVRPRTGHDERSG
ncbi:radical SAM protein [Halanaeroarchaeum sulfurireducens]|uniref:Radical SAM protein n=1 Tax=Halanaeroarchaeum sulfurireducens TaxID=1604004 RepID=A0A0F7PDA3_9EURY|nr:radical SAM protein [Halanaeroarchaeum sulfurireducens]ALG81730.1 radical SAM protein [Halanaeroarchaeum sulfurireducens]